MERHLRKIVPFLGLFFFALAAFVVHIKLKHYDYTQILAALHAVPLPLILLGLLLTALNYLTLTGYDFLALHYVGLRLPKPRVLFASMLAFSLSNNVGHALISGPSVRYRFYQSQGLSGIDLLKVTLFISVTYFTGALPLTLIGFFFMPNSYFESSPMYWVILSVVIVSIAVLLFYWGSLFFIRKPIHIKKVHFYLPTPKIGLMQTLLACGDLILASTVLYLVLQYYGHVPFLSFLVVYLIAQLAGVYSQVPGGLGVFEGAFLLLLGNRIPAHNVIAALIVFRVIYFVIPLVVATLSMLTFEIYERKHFFKQATPNVYRFLESVVPQLISFLFLISGTVLLISTSTPTPKTILHGLEELLPLAVVEISHLVASLVGLMLLLVARAIWLKVNAAYLTAILLLSVGIGASLLKGLEWGNALFLTGVLLLLLPTKHYFYRPSKWMDVAFTWHWFLMIAIILAGVTWLGFFSFKHIEYSQELWWQFAYHADASRFLRSLFLLVVVLTVMALYRLFSIPKMPINFPDEEELARAHQLSFEGKATQAYMALLGDKHLFWNETKTAFVMFDRSQHFWVVMGDPVGDSTAFKTLIWDFKAEANQQGAKMALYQVSEAYLTLYLDLGLSFIKLGEEALVPLSKFSLEGKDNRHARNLVNHFVRHGCQFEILNEKEVIAHLPELREVSNHWLKHKSGKEKKFSLGFFNENYLKYTRVAIARYQGNIVAFANLLETKNKEELSLDLIRYNEFAPKSTMEWLILKIMAWAQTEGYQHFSLGMAPLSGLEKHPLAPKWHKFGNIIYKFGTEFYHFEGLRSFKDKFNPEWKPRYLAVPDTLSVPSVLIAVTKLISGGRGIKKPARKPV